MEGDLASLVEIYYLTKKSGRSAKLILSSKRGAATIAKLEIELDDATPLNVNHTVFNTCCPCSRETATLPSQQCSEG